MLRQNNEWDGSGGVRDKKELRNTRRHRRQVMRIYGYKVRGTAAGRSGRVTE